MPYKLKKKRNEQLYWVITIETGKKHSKEPIPKEKAKAQLRILKSALKGGADQDFDPEMAGLMGEPVQFAPAQANPFAGLFEPRPRRIRRPKPKRAISTVQGAIVTGDEKRKKTQGEYRGQGRRLRGGITKEEYIDYTRNAPEKITTIQANSDFREILSKLTPEQREFIEQKSPGLIDFIELQMANHEELAKDSNYKGTIYNNILTNIKKFYRFLESFFVEKEKKEFFTEELKPGKPSKKPPQEFLPPPPKKKSGKKEGKGHCKKCGLPRR